VAAASPASLAIGLITAAVLIAGPATAAAAAPKPTEAQLRAELKKLNTKVDKLIETYNGKRVELAKAQQDATTAKKRLADADKALESARQRVGEIARIRYQAVNPSLPAFLLTPNDSGSAAVLEQITAEQEAAVQRVAGARDERAQAAQQALALTSRIKAATATVSEQRDEARDVIKDIQKKLADLVPFGPGRNSDGSWAPELPSGTDNITPRMRVIRSEIEKNFHLPFTVGCFRQETDGEHGLGRACDFMMSSGGVIPSAADNALGDSIAAWALKNQSKLGVKYVIWKQRINLGSGWRPMEDRGSITQNHYDHVHISMN
jgi:outer membrane murein-binding lipoprotein Lpp